MGLYDTVKYKQGSDDYEIIQRVYDAIRIGVPHCEPEHQRMFENARFERGIQWSEEDTARQEERERPALPLNSLLKLLNAVANREIMERIVPKVFGVSGEDNALAEVLDFGMQWQRSLSETEHEESLAFRANCSSGIGVMHKWWNPLAFDGEGCIVDEHIPLSWMLWDPAARKQNMIDRKWHTCGKYVDVNEAKDYFADFGDAAKEFKSAISVFGDEDESWNSEPASTGGSWGQILSNTWLSRTGREVFLIEHEWKEIEKYYQVAVPVKMGEYVAAINGEGAIDMGQGPDGQPMQISGQQLAEMEDKQREQVLSQVLQQTKAEKFKAMKDFKPIAEQYEALTGQKFEDYNLEKREVIRFAIVSNGRVLQKGKRISGFTYEFLTGFPQETEEGLKWYGMIDVAKGGQDMKNVFYSNLMTMYMTSPKQHLLIEEGALHDSNAFLDEYAKVSGVSFVPDGFFASKRFELLKPPSFPPMVAELLQIADNVVQDLFGLSSIEMNTQGDLRRISGNVVQAAKAATNTLLAVLFDSLRRYRRRWGMLSIKALTEFYSPQEIARVVGPKKEATAQAIEIVSEMSQWPETFRFDIKIDEAPTSISEQMETINYLTRTGILDKWVDQKILPVSIAIDLMVQIPASVREEWKSAVNEQQQHAQQVQELQKQLQDTQIQNQLFLEIVQTTEGGPEAIKQWQAAVFMGQQLAEQMAQKNESNEPMEQGA